jgi:hypothetical protein
MTTFDIIAKFIFQIGFWGIMMWFFNKWFGTDGILCILAFILFINIITWERQLKKK